MLASDQEKIRGCTFRCYSLPRDQRAELAYALSMTEGRAGRMMGQPLEAEWQDPIACERILRKATTENLGDQSP
eukprot:10589712-Alexandrium_andersonii.AAC.1